MTTHDATAMASVPAANHSNATRGCALALAVTLALGAADPAAGTPPVPASGVVSNCNDGGPGSLREALFQAVDGDTVAIGSTDSTGMFRCPVGSGDMPLVVRVQHPLRGDDLLVPLVEPSVPAGAEHTAIIMDWHAGS